MLQGSLGFLLPPPPWPQYCSRPRQPRPVVTLRASQAPPNCLTERGRTLATKNISGMPREQG
ncbi:uncharacterized protein B0H18DRAFT_1047956, partial [Fomitopsis serialis]|uniref:uncharacterized protein n=1 Tax=Fomitopsis serialis TaxID=139415 RepID=UPI0020074DF5